MYSIKDLSIICGLTERTLRNYLKMGVLRGEKQNGVWRFSEEDIEKFMENDYVSSAVKANRNAVLFDYLNCYPKDENSACIVLHLPKEEPKAVADFFCEAVNKRSGLKMTYDKKKGVNKVVLIGNEKTVYDVLNEYYSVKR